MQATFCLSSEQQFHLFYFSRRALEMEQRAIKFSRDLKSLPCERTHANTFVLLKLLFVVLQSRRANEAWLYALIEGLSETKVKISKNVKFAICKAICHCVGIV